MSRPLMACGCVAQGDRIVEGRKVGPICAVHLEERVAPSPHLTDRMARCDCGAARPSSLKLPLFVYRAECETDRYYCGHAGWN